MSTQQLAPLPICKAILLCREVVKNESGDLSLSGLIGNFFVDQTMTAPPTELFCQLTDACGHYDVSVEVHDLSANEVIGRSEPQGVDISDPLMSIDVILSIRWFQFKNTGLHDIVVFANGEEVDRKQFGVAFLEERDHVVTDQ
jgi:hypothetical protein